MKDTRTTGRKILTFILAIVWLLVVGMAVWIVLTRRAQYGYFVYLVPAMAVLMLVLFTLAFLRKDLSESLAGRRIGDFATGGLILLVLVVLGLALAKQRRIGIGPIALAVFFYVFLRIFLDWLRRTACSRAKRHRPLADAARQADPTAPDNQGDAKDPPGT